MNIDFVNQKKLRENKHNSNNNPDMNNKKIKSIQHLCYYLSNLANQFQFNLQIHKI